MFQIYRLRYCSFGDFSAGDCSWINFSNFTKAALRRFLDTCTAVHLDSDQSAADGEALLDKAFFASKLDVTGLGILDTVRYALLEGKEACKPIRAELMLSVWSFGASRFLLLC